MRIIEKLGPLKDGTDALQHILVSVAIVVGGVWTLYTFRDLNEGGHIREQTRELARKNREQGVLDLVIESETLSTKSSGRTERFLRITVIATNKGNRSMMISFDPVPPVSVARMRFAEDGAGPSFDSARRAWFNIGRDPGQRLARNLIRVGEVYRYSAVVSVKEPGLYWVCFDARVSEEDREPELRAPSDQVHWSASTYAMVE